MQVPNTVFFSSRLDGQVGKEKALAIRQIGAPRQPVIKSVTKPDKQFWKPLDMRNVAMPDFAVPINGLSEDGKWEFYASFSTLDGKTGVGSGNSTKQRTTLKKSTSVSSQVYTVAFDWYNPTKGKPSDSWKGINANGKLVSKGGTEYPIATPLEPLTGKTLTLSGATKYFDIGFDDNGLKRFVAAVPVSSGTGSTSAPASIGASGSSNAPSGSNVPASPNAPAEAGKSNLKLYIGLGVGGAALIALVFFLTKPKKKSKQQAVPAPATFAAPVQVPAPAPAPTPVQATAQPAAPTSGRYRIKHRRT